MNIKSAVVKFDLFSQQNIGVNGAYVVAAIAIEVAIKRNQKKGKSSFALKVVKHTTSLAYCAFVVDKISKI